MGPYPSWQEGAGLGPVCRGFESHRAHISKAPYAVSAYGAFEVSSGAQPRSSRTTGISARKAWPRWEMAFFSAGVSSAQVRDSPRGWRTGS